MNNNIHPYNDMNNKILLFILLFITPQDQVMSSSSYSSISQSQDSRRSEAHAQGGRGFRRGGASAARLPCAARAGAWRSRRDRRKGGR